MTGRSPSPPEPRGVLSIYGVATGLASLVPLPLVDTYLGELTRGSVMRRVGQRYGVELTAEARGILAAAGMSDTIKASRADRWLRTFARRSASPARVAGSIEDALTALLSAAFLEHYLSRHTRPEHTPLDADEARALRDAMASAVAGGLGSLTAATPRGIGKALKDIGTALEKAEAKGRTAPQRLVDALLDSLSNLPEGTLGHFLTRFDEALAEAPPLLPSEPSAALPSEAG